MENLDHKRNILKVLVYIQLHLDEKLTLEKLAKVASISSFHFHRLFHALVGETVHQYVRRLRLEQAAGKLKASKESITSIALDSGFETPSSFTKAFRQVLGQSPKEFRLSKKRKPIVNKEDNLKQKPEIIKMPDLQVLFSRRTGSYFTSPKEAWHVVLDFVKEKGLMGKGVRYFGFGLDDPDITGEDKLRFDACFLPPEKTSPEGEMGTQTIKGGTYAVFLHKGPYDQLGESFAAIYRQWVPNSGYQLAEQHPFCECVDIENKEKPPSEIEVKIYIPIKG